MNNFFQFCRNRAKKNVYSKLKVLHILKTNLTQIKTNEKTDNPFPDAVWGSFLCPNDNQWKSSR